MAFWDTAAVGLWREGRAGRLPGIESSGQSVTQDADEGANEGNPEGFPIFPYLLGLASKILQR